VANERHIIWTLKVEPSKDNAAKSKDFEDKVKKSHESLLKSSRKKTDAEVKTVKKGYDDQLKAFDAHQKKKEQSQAAAEKTAARRRAKERVDAKRHLEKMTADSERAMDKLEGARGRLHSGFAASAGSISQLTGGFVMLGLMGEKNTEKLVRSLIKVKAVMDLAVGATESYKNIREAVLAYRSAVQAASAVESTARAASIAQVNAETVAEGKLAAARGTSAAAAKASAAARVGAGGAVGGGGVQLAATAAITALGAATWVVVEQMTGAANNVNSLSNKIIQTEFNLVSAAERALGNAGKTGPVGHRVITPELRERAAMGESGYIGRFRAGAAQAEIAEIEKEQAEARRSRRDVEEFKQRETAEAGRAAERSRSDAQFGAAAGAREKARTPGERRKLLHREAQLGGAAIGAEREELATTTDPKRQQQAVERLLSLNQRMTTLASDRLSLEKEASQVKRDAATKAINAAKSERDIVRDRLKAEKDRLLSAKERFGQLSAEEQQETLRVFRKQKAGGIGSLTREERRTLAGVGTQETEQAARAGDIRAAERAGFAEMEGAGRRRIAGMEREERKLDVAIRDQREIQVNLERDEDRIAKQVAEIVAARLKEREALLERKIQLEFDRRLEDLDRRAQQHADQQRAQFPNRRG